MAEAQLLGRRVGVTVRFTVAGETSLRRVFAICFKPPCSPLSVYSKNTDSCQGGTVAALY